MSSKKKSNVRTRENWIDWAKAICIYLMIAGHSNISNTLHDFIYLFHMPVFFIISGILFRNRNWVDLARMTFIPMLFFNLVNYPYYIYKQITLYKSDLTTDVLVWKPLMGLFCHDWNIGRPVCGVFWFVLVIFIDKLIGKCLVGRGRSGNKIPWKLVSLLSILCLLLSFLWNGKPNNTYGFILQRAIISLPFFLFGMYGFRYLKRVFDKDRFVCSLIGSLCLIFLLYLTMSGIRMDLYTCDLHHPFVYYASGIAGCVLLYCVLRALPENNYIQNISKGTLVILGMHHLFLFATVKVFGGKPLFENDGIFVSLIAIVAIYPIMTLILNKFPIILGKNK